MTYNMDSRWRPGTAVFNDNEYDALLQATDGEIIAILMIFVSCLVEQTFGSAEGIHSTDGRLELYERQ